MTKDTLLQQAVLAELNWEPNIAAGHMHDDNAYFKSIGEALAGTKGWLVTGPAATKNELASYVEKYAPQLKSQLIGIEPMDHPTDGELVDHARRFFKAADKMKAGEWDGNLA